VLKGAGPWGIGQSGGPCEVGENGFVPWTLGAKGIQVQGTARTNSFFMSIFGWNQVGASASASAFMGVGALADNIGLMPFGLFTRTFDDFGDFQYGDWYPNLVNADTVYGSGNWGWVNYNGLTSGSAQDVRAWLTCGYNPSVNEAQWDSTWCPGYQNVDGYGPTQHYRNAEPNVYPGDMIKVPFLKYGYGLDGWWLAGSSGSPNSNCKDFENRIKAEDDGEGVVVLFPIFDQQVGGGGGSTFYHVRLVVAFRIYEGDVSCRPSDPPPTPTCPAGWACATATPKSGGGGGGGNSHWVIGGYVDHMYSTSSAGQHGDVRHTTVPDVFLDN
jgi:hypothetical protein